MITIKHNKKLKSFIELLNHRFYKNSDRPAVHYNQQIFTYHHLEQKSRAISAFLLEQGLKKGDVVILYTPEKLAFLLIHLGIIRGGGVSLPLNPDFTAGEMTYFLNDSGARFVFASGEQAELIRGIKAMCPGLKAVFDPTLVLSSLETEKEKKIPRLDIEPGDYCFMLYSSGTTGLPKGVIHTHANTGASLLALQTCWKFSQEDVLLNVLPLFHIHGLSFAAHLSLISGSAMIIADRFHPLKVMEQIKVASVFMGVPTYYYAFLNRPEFKENAKQWQRTRLFTCGSAPIRPEVLNKIETIIGKPLINRYGMTESHVITSIPLAGPYKHGSVGLPLEGVEIKIEKNNEEVLEHSELIEHPENTGDNGGLRGDNAEKNEKTGGAGDVSGEVKIRSQNLFDHYWKKPGPTHSAFDEGDFFKTGDMGYLDDDGFLFLVGRKNDLIITSGFNVYPPVVERVINEFPGIKESAVIGVSDALKGEKIMAVIVLEAGKKVDIDELKRFCRKKLVNYQCPVYIEVVDQLPRNTMGKVLKRELKEKFKNHRF